MGYALITLSARQVIDALRPLLANERSVLVGQSGTGKSTIINAALGTQRTKTGVISQSLDSGRNMTSHARLHQLGPAAWFINSPGMKEFGIHHLARSGLERAFVEFRPYLRQRRFRDCTHEHEPQCAIRDACGAGKIAASWLPIYHRRCREII